MNLGIFQRTFERNNKSTGKVRVSTDKLPVNTEGLTEQKEKIVRYVLKNDRITNKEACELLDIKDSRAYKLLREMNESGILKKEGAYRDSYYRIAEDKGAYHAQKVLFSSVYSHMTQYRDILKEEVIFIFIQKPYVSTAINGYKNNFLFLDISIQHHARIYR